MLWKKLVVLAGLIWFTQSYAAPTVAKEHMDDALGHRFEAPQAQKIRKRGVAQQTKSERDLAAETKAEDATEMKYWRWTEDSVEESSKD
ncbi:MAG: hypothetical protein K2P81_08140 [Bacteriovoracaceae bacterium]|nr:hypothetical protein [Bacteriovoracaceae bacterium]